MAAVLFIPGGVLGVLVGLVSYIWFGTGLLGAIGIYVGISIAFVCAGLLLSALNHASRSQSARPAPGSV